ncbi:hypothetical protein [Wenyingzhuangia aestuarii]|uniref:hypothetical protein n=1 Tax=Wenyingzhuangia aestuarii TaxID=1647582 RepID=UPI00143B6782|nr:hypothetical protein [Wenyingzhuangia aestuarii]NJB83140.1 hypothetical protein [Wenyingzhuangia aestuarii]
MLHITLNQTSNQWMQFCFTDGFIKQDYVFSNDRFCLSDFIEMLYELKEHGKSYIYFYKEPGDYYLIFKKTNHHHIRYELRKYLHNPNPLTSLDFIEEEPGCSAIENDVDDDEWNYKIVMCGQTAWFPLITTVNNILKEQHKTPFDEYLKNTSKEFPTKAYHQFKKWYTKNR